MNSKKQISVAHWLKTNSPVEVRQEDKDTRATCLREFEQFLHRLTSVAADEMPPDSRIAIESL